MDIDVLRNLKQRVLDTCLLLHLDDKRAEAAALELQTHAADFWNNPNTARDTSQRMSDLQKEISEWDQLLHDSEDAIGLAELAESEKDSGSTRELEQMSQELQERFEHMEFYVLLAGQYDSHDAIISFHSGAGGDDAQDWAEMLYRMITRFCERKGFRVEVIDYSRGGEAGLKNALIHVRGRYAYGHLKSENGVHRLVRISPFDAEKMRHTSFAMVEVMPDLGEVDDIDIPESDLRIDVFRSGGKGGQSVNTTDSAVRIVHIPTNTTVVCQNEKSQHQNKARAMQILKSRLLKIELDKQEAQRLHLRGEHVAAEWGSQIRSYVLHPYKMVKDHRTGYESNDPDQILNGDLQECIESYLRWNT